MTPLAQKLLRTFISQRNHAGARWVAQATCFDLSPVAPLVLTTAHELNSTQGMDGEGEPRHEHGGLLFLPDTVVWLEAGPGGGLKREGILITQAEDQLGFTMVGENLQMLHGFLLMHPDDEHFSTHLDLRNQRQDAEAIALVARAGLWAASALLLINAPRGVERATRHGHKGLEREAKRFLGAIALRPVHTIRLSTTPGTIGPEGEPGRGSPKAFHFCRSHLRQLASGATTKVRAHWRGDPSLGMTQADYQVKS